MNMMFDDFEFEDDGRRVRCTRGVRSPAGGNASDVRWWYLSVDGAEPVRLLQVSTGETRGEVWDCALNPLDRVVALSGG